MNSDIINYSQSCYGGFHNVVGRTCLVDMSWQFFIRSMLSKLLLKMKPKQLPISSTSPRTSPRSPALHWRDRCDRNFDLCWWHGRARIFRHRFWRGEKIKTRGQLLPRCCCWLNSDWEWSRHPEKAEDFGGAGNAGEGGDSGMVGMAGMRITLDQHSSPVNPSIEQFWGTLLSTGAGWWPADRWWWWRWWPRESTSVRLRVAVSALMRMGRIGAISSLSVWVV